MFFYPSKKELPNANLRRYDYTQIYFTSTDGVLLNGLLLRPRTVSSAAVLYLHGNAQNVGEQIDNILWLADAGFTVFAVDYRGYGRSGGSPDIKGVDEDAKAALKELGTLCPALKDRIIVFGQSLGGSIAIYAVANYKPKSDIKALVVDSSFSGYREIAREKIDHFWPLSYLLYPLTFTINDRYSPSYWIDKIGPVPLLLICSTNDPVVPAKNSYRLFKEAKGPKELWVTNIPGHISFLSREKNRVALIEYLHQHLVQTSVRRARAGN
ncbi:MAG: alpha/beta fold hydrolase [Nitrospiraceae bacterium]|nr:alpha/beta fold hydrolase [Nitrospiraceae bacterium]